MHAQIERNKFNFLENNLFRKKTKLQAILFKTKNEGKKWKQNQLNF